MSDDTMDRWTKQHGGWEDRAAVMRANAGRLPGPRASGRLGNPYSLTRARIERTAALMRAAGGQLPDRKPYAWDRTGKAEEIIGIVKLASSAERRRSKPYLVVYECDGRTFVFGDSEESNGGGAMYCARLLAWVKNPRVVPA